MRIGEECILCLLLVMPSFLVQVNAQEEVGTEITIGVLEKKPEYFNTNIQIRTSHGLPLPEAVLYIRDTDGIYLPVAKTDKSGFCHLYLLPGKSVELLVEHLGFIGKNVEVKRSADREENLVFKLQRIGPYQDFTENDISIQDFSVDDHYVVNEVIAFELLNTDMDDKTPMQGDIRFKPIYWYVEDQSQEHVCEGKFEGISGHFNVRKKGSYKLYVFFQKEVYVDGNWIKEDDYIKKNYDFYVDSYPEEVKDKIENTSKQRDHQSGFKEDFLIADAKSSSNLQLFANRMAKKLKNKSSENEEDMLTYVMKRTDEGHDIWFYKYILMIQAGLQFFLIILLKRNKEEEEDPEDSLTNEEKRTE